MNDIFYDPNRLKKIARVILTSFLHHEIDYVVTIETKGIPLATVLANMLNKPIIVVRKSARLTEGPTIQMNYLAGSTKTIKTMALPIRALERGSKVLFVDDFMKAGGTAKGVIDLMKEFEVEVVGVSVVLATKEPVKKLVEKYYALVELENIDEESRTISIYPKK
jgi:purine operon repressor